MSISLLFQMLIGHAIADYPLQGEFLAKFKDWHNSTGVPSLEGIWPWCMTAHAAIHAGTVWLITGNPILGAWEFFAHWIIDFAKCAGVTNIHIDQFLHVACKVAYVSVGVL